ncbi:hypothetical protein B0H13DRAFT_1914688 [Mycena leptocephala]|nr:hypothetical protein B0H13DRAFT_1914688 [Mycena leptocephala]
MNWNLSWIDRRVQKSSSVGGAGMAHVKVEGLTSPVISFEDEIQAKGTHTGRGRSRNAVRAAPRIGRAEEPVRVQVNEVLVSAVGLTRARYGCVEQKREEEEAKNTSTNCSAVRCARRAGGGLEAGVLHFDGRGAIKKSGERRHGQVVEVTDGVTGAIGRLPNGFGREYLEPRASASGPSRTGFTGKFCLADMGMGSGREFRARV